MRTATMLFATALALLAGGAASASSGGPFSGYSGTWSGSGRLVLEGGAAEALRCRVRYDASADGTALAMRLVCASAAARLGVEASVREAGGKVSGTFTETSKGISGDVSGAVNDGGLAVRVEGLGFSATLRAVTRGARQEVSIAPDGPGTGIRAVSLVLMRR